MIRDPRKRKSLRLIKLPTSADLTDDVDNSTTSIKISKSELKRRYKEKKRLRKLDQLSPDEDVDLPTESSATDLGDGLGKSRLMKKKTPSFMLNPYPFNISPRYRLIHVVCCHLIPPCVLIVLLMQILQEDNVYCKRTTDTSKSSSDQPESKL